MPVLPRLDKYDDIYRQFRWNVPARYNIGVDVCDRWAAREPGRLAILHARTDGRDEEQRCSEITFHFSGLLEAAGGGGRGWSC